jgi:hypothetical protein
MSFRSRGFLGSQLYPPAASFFITKTISNGPLSTSQKRALGYLVNGLTDLGISSNDGNFLIYPFIGSSTGNNSLNLFSAGTAGLNLTFVGSPTQNISGTSFNGTTQYAIGPSLAIYPLGLTTANITMAFCTANMGSSVYIPMGFYMANALQTKTYSTAGSFTFNPNTEAPGITAFTITAFGGGAAGGGANGTTSNFAGGGGAGGGYATRAVTLTKAQGATSMTITVGAGGVATSGGAGGNGGDSIVTHPNFTGINANGGNGGRTNSAGAPGGAAAAGTSNSGSTTFNGGGGAAGGAAVGRGGGGGGSSAGTGAIGNAGSTPTTTAGGAGGTAPTGGVAGGVGGVGTAGGAGFAGSPGTAGGGAGGGAGSTNAGNNRAGGTGGDGKVTVSWTPATFKRFSMSIFNTTGSNLLDCSVDTDATSRFQYITSPTLLNGVRIGGRRANTVSSTDMGFYVENNAGSVVSNAVMSTTSFDPSPLFYFGAVNSQSPGGGGTGNNATNLLNGYLSFAMLGPKLTDTQMQSLYTLISTYNSILGRTP